ncbi:MAG TPA: hypothetical protein VGS97_25095 [Actinocrinis sp.]|uniref:hypothetical protein n=1 Tax=Actinocrinis sp. TaxID=1920516 RepID=UPI002DDCA548|nr:hypothetical protein [Actinocrinis sp.]HEV2347396.1 hypothetical protein [Actinocrinis sp.]
MTIPTTIGSAVVVSVSATFVRAVLPALRSVDDPAGRRLVELLDDASRRRHGDRAQFRLLFDRTDSDALNYLGTLGRVVAANAWPNRTLAASARRIANRVEALGAPAGQPSAR